MEIKITKTEEGMWCIERDGLFHSYLDWSEMLGLFVSLTIHERRGFWSRLHTYEDYLASRFWFFGYPLNDPDPRRLITHQPELTPFIDEDASPFRRIF